MMFEMTKAEAEMTLQKCRDLIPELRGLGDFIRKSNTWGMTTASMNGWHTGDAINDLQRVIEACEGALPHID
jgi:hypothetical protein